MRCVVQLQHANVIGMYRFPFKAEVLIEVNVVLVILALSFLKFAVHVADIYLGA